MPKLPKKLEAGARHIAHEFRMLRRAWAQQSDPLAYTAWFVHCRNLMKFFADKGDDDEILVGHYLLGVEAEWARGIAGITKPTQYGRYWGAADLLAAHLTWNRTDPKWSSYPPSAEITEYLLGLSGFLLCILPPERVVWFGGVQLL